MARDMTHSATDGRVIRGDHTRRLILRRTVDIASMEGLEALSAGRVAADLGISKSGVFSLFGSKEDLQIATVRAALQIFRDTVIEPAMAMPAGLRRLWRLCEAWLDYSANRIFPGGCFFFAVQAEFDSQPGKVRDLLLSSSARWFAIVEACIREAQAAGELAAGADAEQLAFELIAFLEAANAYSLLHDDRRAYDRARRAVADRLRPLTTTAGQLPSADTPPGQG